MTITPTALAGLIDHTQLAAAATKEQFEQLCREAIEYGFAMVAINPYPVELCAKLPRCPWTPPANRCGPPSSGPTPAHTASAPS